MGMHIRYISLRQSDDQNKDQIDKDGPWRMGDRSKSQGVLPNYRATAGRPVPQQVLFLLPSYRVYEVTKIKAPVQLNRSLGATDP